MRTWRDAREAGVSLYVTPQGQLRLKQQGLSANDLNDLRQHRAAIAAEWLWSLSQIPPVLDWDEAIAERVLTVAVDFAAGPGFPPGVDWGAVNRADNALHAAWQKHSLPDVIEAARAWVIAVYELWETACEKAVS